MTNEEAINDLKVLIGYFVEECGAVPVSLEYSMRILEGIEEDGYIVKWLAKTFDRPCNYAFNDESVVEVIDCDANYCVEHCGQDSQECWRRYFEVLKKRDANNYKKC